MKTKLLLILLTGGLVALAAWLVHVPTPASLDPAQPTPVEADKTPDKYRETVSKGLEYLAKNQHKDGHWEGDGGQHPVAMTGLVGLALVMERDRPNGRWIELEVRESKSKYSANVRKAVEWLMDKSQAGRDGLIFSEHPSETARYMEGHGLATLFLAGAYAGDHQKKLTDVLTRSVKYIINAQSSQGGWYHTSKKEGHDFDTILATVIQVQALQAAENAGIPVSNGIISDAQQYLKMAIGKYEEATNKPGQSSSRPVETAAAIACRANRSGWGRMQKDELREKWLKYCQTEIPVGRAIQLGRDELTHYYYAQAVFDRTWNDDQATSNGYRTTMFDHLQSTQNNDGSWPAGDGLSVGSVYSTAVWCTVLQLEKDCHPSTQRIFSK